eukprot:GHVS01059391.1.p1 GENE.GHVS01059391.1~~GHVS01059391.1.p1  ORF type:complete len:261 (-),score=92.80 GHVS01059391.1:223-924(-)
MPVSSGPNSRSVEAKARKKAVQDEAQLEKETKKMDDLWKDDDKQLSAKMNRKTESQQKAEEQRTRKAENRKMAEEEQKALEGVAKSRVTSAAAKKVNRAEIAAARAAAFAKASANKPDAKSRSCLAEDLLVENPNQLLREQRMEAKAKGEDFIMASGLGDAVKALEVDDSGGVDRNPEKRMKAAYKTYEEEWLPQLKRENPTLKRSQLLDLLHKQWKKARENPLNRAKDVVDL